MVKEERTKEKITTITTITSFTPLYFNIPKKMIDDNLEKDIDNYINEHKEDIFNKLSELVRIKSVTGYEGDAQKYIYNLYKDLGLKTILIEPDKEKLRSSKAYCEVPWSYKGRPNVIGVLNKNNNKKSIILNGHIDVVPVEDIEGWKYEPWSGKITEDRIYGRGSSDMKAGLIVNYYAVKTLIDLNKKPEGQIILESVVEEEAGGGGTLSCFLEGYNADGMILTEPGMGIVIAHAGACYFKVRVIGKSVHAQYGHRGVNAIEKMNKICDELFDLDKKRAKNNKYELFEQSNGRSCHLIVGEYNAGNWPSSVPGEAEINCRISFIPGETEGNVKKEVENAINKVTKKDNWLNKNKPIIEWYGWHGEPWEEEKDKEMIIEFKKVAEYVLKNKVKYVGKAAGMDNRFAKYFNTVALAFGPNGNNIHGMNEYVEKKSILECIKIMAIFVKKWCSEDKKK